MVTQIERCLIFYSTSYVCRDDFKGEETESQNHTKPSVCIFFSNSCESPTASHNVTKKPMATLPQHNKPHNTQPKTKINNGTMTPPPSPASSGSNFLGKCNLGWEIRSEFRKIPENFRFRTHFRPFFFRFRFRFRSE